MPAVVELQLPGLFCRAEAGRQGAPLHTARASASVADITEAQATARQILQGDCLEILPTLAECSVDTIITDPPYGLEFMGKSWDGQVPGVAYWEACLRVAKPGALLLAFGGTRTWHRLAVAIEDSGWELRDTLMWLYGSGFPKSLDVSKAIDKAAGSPVAEHGAIKMAGDYGGRDLPNARHGYDVRKPHTPATEAAKQWDGYGTSLKPAFEPILVAMKPLDGTFAQNAQKWGVAGLHIDGARTGTDKRTNYGGNPGGNSVRLKGGDGRNVENAHRYADASKKLPSTTVQGRWPANLLLDEQAAAMLDEQSGDRSSTRVGNPRNPVRGKNHNATSYGQGDGKQTVDHRDTGGPSRYFYTSKASRKDRVEGNRHPTVKPLSLMRWLCRLTRPPGGGVVLDPFMGSGSTLVAAQEEGRRAIGIELDPVWCEVARGRLRQGVLFEEPAEGQASG